MEFTKNLYELVEKNGDSFSVLISSQEHPIFKAHFPNYPILPGFLLIEIALEVLKITPCCIKSAKFIKHIVPEDRLTYRVEHRGLKTKIVVLNSSNVKVSEFILHKDKKCT